MVAKFPAWLPPLTDLDKRTAQPIPVTDASLAFDESVRRDVLAKRPCRPKQRVAAKFDIPCGVMVVRIVVQRLVGTAMRAKVGLLVAGRAKRADGDRPFAPNFGDRTGIAVIGKTRNPPSARVTFSSM